MANNSQNIQDLVVGEVSDFAKVPKDLIKLTHKLGTDLRLVKPALVFLTGSLRAHIKHRNPNATLLVTEIEKADFTVEQLVKLVTERMGTKKAWHNTVLARGLGIALLLSLMSPPSAFAQDSVWSGFQIRKAFNGGRDEQQPASFAYVFRNDDAGEDFALVDLAIKHKGYNRPAGDRALSPEVLIYPSMEWHRGEAESLRGVASAVNKLAGSANIECYFGDVVGTDRNRPVLAPWMFLKGEATRNFIKDTNEASITALASVYSIKDWLPGADTTFRGRRFLRYVPYAGLEYFSNLAVEQSSKVLVPSYSGLQLTMRLYVEVFPLMATIPGQNRVVITAETNHRSALSGDDVDSALVATSVSADVYLDGQQRLAIGLTHDRGAFPKANFQDQRRTYISFRVKL